ncbi:SIR2 family protein [Acinetobacter johnsonii]|nr:SIR2 family protein [Acinetobacter johnsonii]
MSFTVQEVAQLLKQAKENEKPYVFFTGAGCSVKAGVPSATGLIKEICEKFPIQVKNLDPEEDKYNYGKYMSALDKDERRRLLKPHIIDNKKINWAHIALACLMEAGYIERVLTFNFDSILSRACNMLGLHPSIYDFATANPHLYHLINDPSIVHLHGQGTGFVQLNTANETKEHTEKLSDFIANTLNSNPSLFIGYSGNADAFFPLLEEKYSEQHRLIWTGTRAKIDEIESESVKTFLKKNNNITHYIGDIYADDFLIQLAKELDCFPPELFLNPYNFLKQQLDLIQDYPLSDGLDVLSNLREYLSEQANKSLTTTLYTAFIHKYPDQTTTSNLNKNEINDVMWAYDQQAQHQFYAKKYDDCFSLYEKALNIDSQHVGCICNFALSLTTFGKNTKNLEPAIKAQTLLTAIKNDTNPAIQITLANCLAVSGSITSDQNYYEESFKILDDVLLRYPHNLKAIHLSIITSMDFGELLQDETFFIKALNHIELFLNLSPDDLDTLINRSITLLALSRITLDENYMNKALDSIKTVIKIDPDERYNLACYYAISKQLDLAKQSLLSTEKSNRLPKKSFKHLSNDRDLDNVRKEAWFIELLERLKVKEEAEEVE